MQRPHLPRLLLGALLSGLLSLPLGLALGAGVPAGAAPGDDCPRPETASSAKNAGAVFTGEITDSVRVTSDAAVTFTHDVVVERVYKGQVADSTVQVQTNGGTSTCSLGRLELGESYLFFVQLDGDLWIATGSGGTGPATSSAVSELESLLGSGRPATPPTTEPAEFTRVAGAEPVSLTRAAAPGGALVLIGLLGLVVVGRLGRR